MILKRINDGGRLQGRKHFRLTMESQAPNNEAASYGLRSANNFDQDRGFVKKQEHDLPIETILAERYEILELLGKGGHGSVYKAKDLRLGITVAVKVLHPNYRDDKNIVARFKQEADVSSRLNTCPHIVAASDSWICEKTNVLFIAMEFVPGTSLEKVLKPAQPLEVARSLHIMIQLCKGMSDAHKTDILHRDIKPSNILLTNRDDDPDFVKIADFGIAKVLNDSEEIKNLGLTKTGDAPPGTYKYMSPEQCLGKPLGRGSDIYSMGCVLYELLTGKPLFDKASPSEILGRHITGLEAPELVLSSVEPVISRRLANIVSTALANDPEVRYKSVDKLRTDLQSVQLRLNQLKSEKVNKALLPIEMTGLFLSRQMRNLLSLWLTKQSIYSKFMMFFGAVAILLVAWLLISSVLDIIGGNYEYQPIRHEVPSILPSDKVPAKGLLDRKDQLALYIEDADDERNASDFRLALSLYDKAEQKANKIENAHAQQARIWLGRAICFLLQMIEKTQFTVLVAVLRNSLKLQKGLSMLFLASPMRFADKLYIN